MVPTTFLQTSHLHWPSPLDFRTLLCDPPQSSLLLKRVQENKAETILWKRIIMCFVCGNGVHGPLGPLMSYSALSIQILLHLVLAENILFPERQVSSNLRNWGRCACPHTKKTRSLRSVIHVSSHLQAYMYWPSLATFKGVPASSKSECAKTCRNEFPGSLVRNQP